MAPISKLDQLNGMTKLDEQAQALREILYSEEHDYAELKAKEAAIKKLDLGFFLLVLEGLKELFEVFKRFAYSEKRQEWKKPHWWAFGATAAIFKAVFKLMEISGYLAKKAQLNIDIMKIDLSDIRQFWIFLMGILATFNFLPDWVVALGGPEGTDALFYAIEAVIALIQFLPFRKEKAGDPNVAELRVHSTGAKLRYLIPWTKAPGRRRAA